VKARRACACGTRRTCRRRHRRPGGEHAVLGAVRPATTPVPRRGAAPVRADPGRDRAGVHPRL